MKDLNKMMFASSKPFVGQKGTFWPSKKDGDEGRPIGCVVSHVWSDTCVNLECDDGTKPTSVLVLHFDQLDAPGAPTGYYCWLTPGHELAAGTTTLSATSLNEMQANLSGAMMVQPKITGYRQLDAEEAALMNEAKALAEQCGAFIEKLRQHKPTVQPVGHLAKGIAPELDQRWVSLGATDLQRGFMAVIRGIAKPTTF